MCESEDKNETDTNSRHHQAAQQFHEANGTAALEETLEKAVLAWLVLRLRPNGNHKIEFPE